VEEEKDFGGIGVTFCEGEEIEIAVADVEVLLLSVIIHALPVGNTR
jgi:hypothetical protein